MKSEIFVKLNMQLVLQNLEEKQSYYKVFKMIKGIKVFFVPIILLKFEKINDQIVHVTYKQCEYDNSSNISDNQISITNENTLDFIPIINITSTFEFDLFYANLIDCINDNCINDNDNCVYCIFIENERAEIRKTEHEGYSEVVK